MVKKRKRKTKNKEEPLPSDIVLIGDGMYMDNNNPDIMVVNPVEVLVSRNIPITQVAILEIYSTLLQASSAAEVELVLISQDLATTDIESIVEDTPGEEPVMAKNLEYDGEERRRFVRD